MALNSNSRTKRLLASSRARSPRAPTNHKRETTAAAHVQRAVYVRVRTYAYTLYVSYTCVAAMTSRETDIEAREVTAWLKYVKHTYNDCYNATDKGEVFKDASTSLCVPYETICNRKSGLSSRLPPLTQVGGSPKASPHQSRHQCT